MPSTAVRTASGENGSQSELAGIGELVLRGRAGRTLDFYRAKEKFARRGKDQDDSAGGIALPFHVNLGKTPGIVQSLDGAANFVFIERLIDFLLQKRQEPLRMLIARAVNLNIGNFDSL